MAFYLLSIPSEFEYVLWRRVAAVADNSCFARNKRVCELGAGMAGLAAFAVAATTSAAHVLLTEGNPVCVDSALTRASAFARSLHVQTSRP